MNIEGTIAAVEKLYTQVTGQVLSAGNLKHNIQPNVDPIALLEARLNELHQMLQNPAVLKQLQPWTPPMAIWESEDKILIRVDLPAVSKEEVDISLRGNVLVITGNRSALPLVAGYIPRHTEMAFGQFYRQIQLPIENLTPEVTSSIKDGVLEVSIAKQTGDRGKKSGSGSKSMQ